MFKITPEIEENIKQQYLSMKKNNETEGFVQEIEPLKSLKIFINTKPAYVMLAFQFEGEEVFIGSESMGTTEGIA